MKIIEVKPKEKIIKKGKDIQLDEEEIKATEKIKPRVQETIFKAGKGRIIEEKKIKKGNGVWK